MTRLSLATVAVSLSYACAIGSGNTPRGVPPQPSDGLQSKQVDAHTSALKPFRSMDELRRMMTGVAEARRDARERARKAREEQCRAWAESDPAVGIDCASPLGEAVTVTASASSITNNQHDGLDEGGIVKRHGDILLVLRRGRLFTFAIGGEQLDALDVADLGPIPTHPFGTWYDELLVWENTVVVIGFSYERGGTEIGLFELGPAGGLRYRATYHLRSQDYYSGANYSSRLIGNRLVLYTTSWLGDNTDPEKWLPALRRSDGPMPSPAFENIATIDRIFSGQSDISAYPTVHSMVSCDLAAPVFTCEATVVLGPALRTYYASPTAAYAWTGDWDELSRFVLYRLPYDGSPVTAIGVTGTPPDQMAFLEDEHQHLNVVVTHDETVVTLLRLPISSFSDGTVDVPSSFYRRIARNLGPWVTARFVGAYVLVGARTWNPDYDAPEQYGEGRQLAVTRWAGGRRLLLPLAHDVQRIEAIGVHAIAVGSHQNSVGMTAIRLGPEPRVAGALMQQDAAQSEHRSHGFFYRADGNDGGLLGLPVVTAVVNHPHDLQRVSARIQFVRNRNLSLREAGALDARVGSKADDHCRVSCVDWYGSARPIFVGERIFALLGYEIVEGRIADSRVEEIRRLDFTPATAPR